MILRSQNLDRLIAYPSEGEMSGGGDGALRTSKDDLLFCNGDRSLEQRVNSPRRRVATA